MLQGFESMPDDETKERVRNPFWACAGALATTAMPESSAKPNICNFMTMPLFAEPLRLARGYIIAQRVRDRDRCYRPCRRHRQLFLRRHWCLIVLGIRRFGRHQQFQPRHQP